MSNKVTGSDALSKSVNELIQQSQSTNETNISASLNTREVTAKESYFASKEAILGDTQRTSAKKKTFSVFETKQAVSPIAAKVKAKLTTELDSISLIEIEKLEKLSGITILSDSDLDLARKIQNTSISTNLTIAQNLELFNSNSSYSLPEYMSDNEDVNEILSRSLSLYDTAAENTSAFSSSFLQPILGQINVPETKLNSFSAGFGEIKDTVASGSTLGTFAEGLSLNKFLEVKASLGGVLKDYNGCPDLSNAFGGKLFDLNALMLALMALLNLDVDLGCFNELIQQVGGPNLESLLQTSVGKGSIGNVSILVDAIGPANILDPADLIKSVAKNQKVSSDSYGNVNPLTDFDTNMDDLIGRFQLSKAQVFGSTESVLSIGEITSYGNDDTIAYAFGSDNTDLLKSLPQLF